MEDEEVSVNVEVIFDASAILLQSLKPISLVINLLVIVLNSIIVAVDIVMVVLNVMLVLTDALFKVVDFVVQIDKCFSDGFKRDHKLGFSLDSILILVLGPSFLPFVEVVH